MVDRVPSARMPGASRLASLLAGVLLLAPATAAAGPATAAVAAPSLADLRQGGFVIFLRHAATDPATSERDGPGLGDCEAQRILSDAGRADARAIGEAVRDLAVPVGEVRSSTWCRALETARLAFGRAEPEPLLASLHGRDEAEKRRLVEALREMLARPPRPGTNTVLVGHGFNLAGAARVPIAQGEAAVFRPLGAGGYRLVGRIGPRDWRQLENRAR